MEPNIFGTVEEMISIASLSKITGNTIESMDRGNFQNEGFSGNSLERLILTTSGGQVINLILKHFDIKGDWLMRLTHDDVVRAGAVVDRPGVGPLLVAPTATDDALGSGKWQAGAAFVIFDFASPKLQYGGLATYQRSFAGDDDRSDVSSMILQPLVFWQLGKGTYLRSSPAWASTRV